MGISAFNLLSRDRATRRLRAMAIGFLFATIVFSHPHLLAAENAPPHAATVRTGVVPTSDGLTLHLNTDLGSIRIQSQQPGGSPAVRYTVHIETDARDPIAQKLLEEYTLSASAVPSGVNISGSLPPTKAHEHRKGQFWVTFTVSVPAGYSVEVSTGGGDIETDDLGGRAVLSTQGGNITTGRIGYRGFIPASNDRLAAKLDTEGGHITVRDVSGDLDAYTAGGHIQAGNVEGNAKLRTGGGHVRAGQIKGRAQLETEGGNITVGEAGGLVTVRTGGGQIDFGEVHGSVHAQTAGGGIRVMYVAGPMEVVTSGGSICMTRITNTVRAETGDGTITAWISPDAPDSRRPVRLPGASQLASGTGDIVVFLPRNIIATIDATVESGGVHRIEADPALSLNVQSRPDGQVHAIGALNGGGATLRLKTTSGKIRLQYLDTDTALRDSLMAEQKRRIAEKLSGEGNSLLLAATAPIPSGPGAQGNKPDWLDRWACGLEGFIWGGVHEDPAEFNKHLLASPPPDYPQVARRAGLQGVVRLQVRLKPDGSLAVEKVLEGEPALVEAAKAAIQQWRATPEQWCGKNVDVISTVTFNFQLH